MTSKPEVIGSSGNPLVLTEFASFKSGDVKGTIRRDMRLPFYIKRRPPTPFDINQLHLIVALSRQRPRVRVPSSPPILSNTCKELAISIMVQLGQWFSLVEYHPNEFA